MIFQSEFPPVPELERPIADEWLEAIWRHGAEDPKRAAFIMAETGEQISFHRLYVTSLSVAAFLERAGFGRGDLAAAVLRNTWEYFAIFFGCGLRGGGLSGASPLFTNFELHQQFADSNAKLIFCMDYSLENVLKAAHECPQLQKIVVVGEQAASRAARVHDGVEIVPFSDVLRTLPTATKTVGDVDLRKDVVVMPYSSGTTGPPKGVMQGNHNYGTMLRIAFEHYDKQIARKMDPNWDWRREHLQLVLPFGFTTTLLGLWGGATGVIISKYEPKIFLKTLQDYRIRLVFMVPPMILLLAKSPIVRDYDLSSVAFIQTGAAPLGHETIEMVKSRLPNLRQIGQGYGCTELSFSNHLPVCGVDVPQASGKLLSNCEMKIVDLKSGRPTSATWTSGV
ncbi:4-coumarate--CoA ligase 3 [Aphelenchoides fujianensis]|nr:4-coumarate--CoA ligase 3 [Aphelenchoides fujianensis]